jgi:anti-sigma B factor antagonist
MGFTPFTARIEPGRSATTIALGGELDMATAPLLEERLVRAESDGPKAILIDLRELTFMDSTGLHAFVSARNRAETNGRQLHLIGAIAPVRCMFELIDQGFLLNDENVASVLQR